MNVVVEAEVPPGFGQVTVGAALGSLAGIRIEANGRVTAQYFPPQGFAPNVDIVTVMSQHGGRWKFGYVAVPLVGQGTAMVRTRPLAQAVIQIGTASFGPGEANARGMAEIPVHVPPGISCGYDQQARPVDLGALPPAGVALFPVPHSSPLIAGQSLEVFGVLVADDGSLVTEQESEFVLSASQGAVRGLRRSADGVLTFRVQTSRRKDGYLTLTLARVDRPPVERTVSIVFPPAPPLTKPEAEAEAVFAFDSLALCATAGLAGSIYDTLGPWLGLSLTSRALWYQQSVHALVGGMFFSDGGDFPIAHLPENVEPRRAHVSTLLVPVVVGLGWTAALSGRARLDMTALGGLGVARTRVEMPNDIRTFQSRTLENTVGGSFGGRMGLGLSLKRTQLRLDAGFQWTASNESMVTRPSLSVWYVSLAFDVEVLSEEKPRPTARLQGNPTLSK
jgi:hypothetical protein